MMDSLLSILLLTGALAGSTKKRRVTLEGVVAGLPDGDVKLRNQTGILTEARLIDGRFRMEFKATFPNDYTLVFENGHRIPFIAEKEYIFADIDFYNDPTFTEITQFHQEKLLPVPVTAGEK